MLSAMINAHADYSKLLDNDTWQKIATDQFKLFISWKKFYWPNKINFIAFLNIKLLSNSKPQKCYYNSQLFKK